MAHEAVVPASLAATVALTAAPGPMPTAAPEPMRTAILPTMATAARAMATAMGRGDTTTGLMASMPTATVLTRAAVITPTSTAPARAHTGAFGPAPNSHRGCYATAPRYARRGALRDMKAFWRMNVHRSGHPEPRFDALGVPHRRPRLATRRHLHAALPRSPSAHRR